MKYCTRCLYPDTKPDLSFNEEGVCSACLAFDARKNIDWESRRIEFTQLAAKMFSMATDNQPYHCVVPVSGGKDSHYQIIKALDYGLNPLAVTAITDDLTEIGNRNLQNISKLGVDHVCVATNARLRRNINAYTLRTIGDISWAEHVTIFTVPVREAMLRKIPYILWGENPQNEYGGPNIDSQQTMGMKDHWLQEFGGLNGLRVQDIALAGIATIKELKQYYYPMKSDFIPQSLYLGQYFPWDGQENARIAMEHGFEVWHQGIEGNGSVYENLDNYQTGIHDRFKYIKFGFGRATDIACNLIRRGKISREGGIEFVQTYDDAPCEYLDRRYEDILAPIGISMDEYYAIQAKFTNLDLFELDGYPHGIPRPVFTVGENA